MICPTVALVLHLWSLHTVPVPNSHTYGVGVECRREELTYVAGYYDNSYSRPSYYAAVGHAWGDKLKLGLFAGGVVGYTKEQAPQWKGIAPLVGVSLSYKLAPSWEVAAQVIPGAHGLVAHFTTSWVF